MTSEPPRRHYHFGPLALFERFRRWHATAPLWQVLLLTALLLEFIIVTWSSYCGLLLHP